MRLTWFGHSTVLIETAGIRVIADPLLRPWIGGLRRAHELPEAVAELYRDGVDAVLVSHLHHDHCDIPSLRALRPPVLVASPGSSRWLARRGLPGAVELAPGQALDLGAGVRVVATQAEHVGRRAPLGPIAMSVGHLVEGPDSTAWLAGDTGLFVGMDRLSELSRHGRIDIAAIPVWGWGPTIGPGHLSPERAAEAVHRAGVRQAVPVHWGTLHPVFLRRLMRPQLITPGPRFAAAVAAIGATATAEVLVIGEALAVS